MTKIDKSVTSKLHSIIQKCIVNKIYANTKNSKIWELFVNVQPMVVQLVVYLKLSLPLYHLS